MRRLEVLIGTWDVEAVFAGTLAEGGSVVFEWMEGKNLLIQRTEAPEPAPNSLAVVAYDADKAAFVQHYFDSRGVARLYAMTFSDKTWTLMRTAADFSPLDFAQRFVGTLTDRGRTIEGRWERSPDGSTWEKDFDLTYRRVTV